MRKVIVLNTNPTGFRRKNYYFPQSKARKVEPLVGNFIRRKRIYGLEKQKMREVKFLFFCLKYKIEGRNFITSKTKRKVITLVLSIKI